LHETQHIQVAVPIKLLLPLRLGYYPSFGDCSPFLPNTTLREFIEHRYATSLALVVFDH
jgi:hypothetical protein